MRNKENPLPSPSAASFGGSRRCIPAFPSGSFPHKTLLKENQAKASFIYTYSNRGRKAMLFTVGTKLKIKENQTNKGKTPKLPCSEEGGEERPPSPAAQPPQAPMARKLLPARPDPSPVTGIFQPLAPREGRCRGWRIQRAQLPHLKAVPPSRGARDSRSQAGPGSRSNQGP